MGLRVSEINSVSCGRDGGVADAFATALWAPDTLFAMVKAGVNGVSWHIRPKPLNAPFHFKHGGGIVPEPELYGLAAFARMTQGPSRLLGSRVSGPRDTRLRAWVVQSRGIYRVLLINKAWQTLRVSLPTRGRRRDAVRWLTAPGPRATASVRLAGQRIGADALWHGSAVVKHQRSSGGRFHVRLGPYSEALVTL